MKTNNHSSAEARAPALALSDILDQLHTVKWLNEALHMASSDGSITSDATNALQSLIYEIDRKLRSIGSELEEIINEVEFHGEALTALTKVIDAGDVFTAVRAEIARRKRVSGEAA